MFNLAKAVAPAVRSAVSIPIIISIYTHVNIDPISS